MVAVSRKVDVQKALQMRREGKSIPEIAKVFDVSRQRIHQYLVANDAAGPVLLNRTCAVCGKPFSRKYLKGSLLHCSKKCQSLAKREAERKVRHDRCRCGREKLKKSAACRQCGWKFDLDIAVQAYRAGATAKQIAEYYGIEKSGIYNHFRRRKIKARDRGYRCKFTSREAADMIRVLEGLKGEQK